LAYENLKFFWEKVKLGSPKKLSEIGGNLKQGGNASLPQGVDAPALYMLKLS